MKINIKYSIKKLVNKEQYKATAQIVSFTTALIGFVYLNIQVIDNSYINSLTKYIIIAFLPIGIAIGYLIYKIQTEDKHIDSRRRILLDNKLKLNQIIDEGSSDENIFKIELLNWRISYEMNKLKGMLSNNLILPIHKQFNYMRIVYSNLIINLNEGDEYVTVSTIDFWQDHSIKNIGRNEFSEFMKYNINAVKKGAFIHRVIIVDEALLGEIIDNKIASDKKTLSELTEDIIRVEQFLKSEVENEDNYNVQNKSKIFQQKSIVERFCTKFIVLPSTRYKEKNNDYAPYCIISSNNNYQVAAFIEDLHTAGTLPKINIKFYNDNPESAKKWDFEVYFKKFRFLFKNETAIDALKMKEQIDQSVLNNINRNNF